ncbi:hypothetical protein [Limibacillus sp. MBR-115]|jgi:hypothetical protein|uniref:hypothetical protein n=1 Tax=Limibacillus sp. MBR-115 TaxID=3156465 RepID=UPI00339571C6
MPHGEARTNLLRPILEREAEAPDSEALRLLVEKARSRHPGAMAVLFYGSCLRDGITEDRMADLYVVVRSYREAHRNPVSALFNALLPPNVYYLEAGNAAQTFRAKYAVVSMNQLHSRVKGSALHPYFWARFSQPTAIAWHDSDDTRDTCLKIFERAQQTMLAAALPTVLAETSDQIWLHALKQTYATELRAENALRGADILATDPERYRLTGELFLKSVEGSWRKPVWFGRSLWWMRRAIGKPLSVLRLMKAAFTFAGGATYLAWKVERHSGVRIPLTEWQKRHPILAGIPLAIKLYRQGALR